jgi:parallel beta-helix repeat protein
VGGGGGLGMLQTRCIWTLATSHALVHDNHVHNCSLHALDFDAYTSSSVAWSNLCEGNGEEGIFLEESAKDCSLFNNTCQHNGDGIGVYSNAVGPVANNFIINNRLINNRRLGLSAGGYGHTGPDHHGLPISLSNIFASNFISGNAYDRSPTRYGPAPDAQVNPAHGATSMDYWTGNNSHGR